MLTTFGRSKTPERLYQPAVPEVALTSVNGQSMDLSEGEPKATGGDGHSAGFVEPASQVTKEKEAVEGSRAIPEEKQGTEEGQGISGQGAEPVEGGLGASEGERGLAESARVVPECLDLSKVLLFSLCSLSKTLFLG